MLYYIPHKLNQYGDGQTSCSMCQNIERLSNIFYILIIYIIFTHSFTFSALLHSFTHPFTFLRTPSQFHTPLYIFMHSFIFFRTPLHFHIFLQHFAPFQKKTRTFLKKRAPLAPMHNPHALSV